MSRLYTLYHFDDGKRTPWVVGGDPCSLLRRGEIGREMGIKCELVSPDGEVVWPEPKDGGEPFIEMERRLR